MRYRTFGEKLNHAPGIVSGPSNFYGGRNASSSRARDLSAMKMAAQISVKWMGG